MLGRIRQTRLQPEAKPLWLESNLGEVGTLTESNQNGSDLAMQSLYTMAEGDGEAASFALFVAEMAEESTSERRTFIKVIRMVKIRMLEIQSGSLFQYF